MKDDLLSFSVVPRSPGQTETPTWDRLHVGYFTSYTLFGTCVVPNRLIRID